MNISNITPPQVWASSSRSLTNFGSGALAPTSTVFTALAGAATVDLRPSAGIVASQAIGVLTGAGATALISVDFFDGTSSISAVATAAAAASSAFTVMVGTSSVGARVRNADATHAGNYLVAAYSLTI